MAAVVRFGRSSEEHDKQLLPGIPNDITFSDIVGKLSWRDFYSLSAVCHGWCHAIRSRQVYDARVRSHSTDTLALLRHGWPDWRFSIYDMRDQTLSELPKIPVEQGNPECFRCVGLDGKVYVLLGIMLLGAGSFDELDDWPEPMIYGRLYVLDLAAQRPWKQCADMKEPRAQFGCGVLDGKIYVIGGLARRSRAPLGSEVYDPKTDVWSSTTAMPSWRTNHHVVTVGAELLVYSGVVIIPLGAEGPTERQNRTKFPDCWEIYHPGLDEWRTAKFDWVHGLQMFSEKEKLYSLHGCNIRIHDVDRHSLAQLHRLSLAGSDHLCSIKSIVAVDDEILAIGMFRRGDRVESRCRLVRGVFQGSGLESFVGGLFQGSELGSENQEMVLQRVPFPSSTKQLLSDPHTMDIIRL